MIGDGPSLKPCIFIGSSRRDLSGFPDEVRVGIGHALYEAQRGEEAVSAKALQGFGGRGVLEIVENFDGETYRAVYTVRLAGILYVLHAFQKKSRRGAETPKHDIELIRARLRAAEEHHRAAEQGGAPKT